MEQFTVYYWTVTTSYELFAFRGNDPETDKVLVSYFGLISFKISLHSRRAIYTVTRRFESPPFPKESDIFVSDVNIGPLLRHLSASNAKSGIGIKVGVGSGIVVQMPDPKENVKKGKDTDVLRPNSYDFSKEKSEVRLDFKIDRLKDTCRTPARNEDVKPVLKFLKKLHLWSREARIDRYCAHTLGYCLSHIQFW